MVVRGSIEDSVRQNLQRELASDQKVWARLVDQKVKRLQFGASVLASEFGFKQAIASGDVPTIESALENSGDRIDATISAFLDPDFNLKAMANPQESAELGQTLTLLGRAMARDQQQGSMSVELGRLHQFVMVPVKAPLVVGWVVMGFAVDQDLAAELNGLSGAHVVLLNRAGTASQRIIHSTLDNARMADVDALLGGAAMLSLGGEDYAALRVDIGAADRPLQVVLLRSTAEAKAVFARMQSVLLLIGALGLVLFALGSTAMARRVSRPLDLLVADTERLGSGDYSQPVQDFGQKDEVGNLARSFDRMRINIQASQAQIRQLAYWDSLTGLPNRAQFREAVQAQLDNTQAGPAQLAVIILDLDRLKHINDVLGYAFGDRILQALAGRLQGVARSGQHLVARLAGGEFAFLLPGADAAQALVVAATIASAFESPVALEGQTVDLSAGMGIACWPGDADQADILLGRAEVAMYVAKHRSLGVQVYDPSLDSASAQTLSLLSELRQAIDGNELRLFLQPKINLQTHQVVAAEALVRWQHPTRGMVQPMQFIPFAEQTGFVRHLTLWMLEEAAGQWKSLQPDEGMLRIAANLSTRDLMDPDFPAKVDSILLRHNVPHAGFCLEITESAIMDDPQRAEATLNQLATSGYKLSIDDFGTGYSSLAYLKRLPVNELKIDKSFVMGMETDESDLKIVRSTIDLAHNLGLTVVAEGVENRHIYQLLANSQCDEAQGYHMSRPILCTEFLDWCEGWYGGHSQTAKL
ncbi:MAG: EAL domain-containing protein [Rhodoferax sp.]|nr:EAL domain-containing protein [Rhodoferax sp.]